MKRFTVSLPDDLNAWLEKEAELNNRSKCKQIRQILEFVRKENEKRRCNIGISAMCSGDVHNFKAQNPAMNEFCNCGTLLYGEVIR